MFAYFAEPTAHQQQLPQTDHWNQNQGEEQRLLWEHSRMMKQDYEGLFYRKLNLIIMLEQSEQAYHQRQILMISHRDHSNTDQPFSHRQQTLDVHPVSYLTKEMVRQNEKLKAEMRLRRKEAEIKVEINKLEIDRKCLLEEITIFNSKINDIAHEYLEDNECKEVETMLLQHGKRYNLSTTIIAFIKQAKEITASNIISDCLKSALKRVNCNSHKPLLKLQDLKLPHLSSKSKRQLLDHITLYLKQFRSITIFKQLSEVLNCLITAYDRISLHSHYLFNKISEEIYSNLQLFSKVNQELKKYDNQLKDYKIEIEILIEEIKISEKEIKELQQRSAQCIAEEAAFLSRQYGESKNLRLMDESFNIEATSEKGKEPLTDYISYFQQQLKQKYQQFVRNQLQDAQHIRILKQKIQDQATNLERLKNFYHFNTKSPQSELQTHRSIEQSIFSEFNYPLKEANTNKKVDQQRSNQPTSRQSVKRCSPLSQFLGNKQKFLVKKIYKISNSAKTTLISHQRDKVYELKLTKKHLILQQKTKNALQFNEKVQIERIKSYKVEDNQELISFDCGHNSLKLQFLSGNVSLFMGKLDRLSRMSKQNNVSSRR